MNTGIVELLTFGLVAIIAGIFLLISMVRELAPNERRKWLLGIGLGTGIIAFSLKIGLIVIFSLYPGPMLSLFPEREIDYASVMTTANRLYDPRMVKTPYTWQALPTSAPTPKTMRRAQKRSGSAKRSSSTSGYPLMAPSPALPAMN